MHDTKVGRIQVTDEPGPRPGWLSRDSFLWLILVTVLFLAAELTPSLLRMPLGPDEMTYIARTSAHASGVFLPPVHGHGVGLLAAPVTLLTTSLVALRIWMAVLSALGLFLAVLCWRGLRPAWVLALAALILGSLAITQNSGVQVYPDWWGAVGILALTGLFLHAVNGTMRPGLVLTLIAAASFLIVMMRPQNIVFILGPAIAAVVFVPAWRKPKVLAAMGVGDRAWADRVGSRGIPVVRRPGQPHPPGRPGAAKLAPLLLLLDSGQGAERPLVLPDHHRLPRRLDARRARVVCGPAGPGHPRPLCRMAD